MLIILAAFAFFTLNSLKAVEPNAPLQLGKVENAGNAGDADGIVFREINLLAVDQDGRGATVLLKIWTAPGKGEMFLKNSLDLPGPVLDSDAQESLQTAFEVAKKLAGNSANGKDVFYEFESGFGAAGGKSAGAAIAVATLSAFKNQSLRKDALITGSIRNDDVGTMQPVSKIIQKAFAAKNQGFTTIIAPYGSLVEDEANASFASGAAIIEVPNVLKAYEEMRKNAN